MGLEIMEMRRELRSGHVRGVPFATTMEEERDCRVVR
jgi:hypothetical protein